MRNKNLMWEILKKNDMMNGNTELMELVMNVTGTLIFDDKGEIQFIGPQANHRGLIRGADVWRTGHYLWLYIHGDCLKTRNRTVTVSQNNSLNQRVQNMIKNISDKLVSDDPLTSQEKGFIESTSVPILRYTVDPQMLNISTFYPSLSDYIAYDILLQYLNELLSQAGTGRQ